ncbi:MAG: metallophosphoesterase [Anaerolineales bacterium]|jgi:predicted phosphodiesterase
MSRLRRLSLLIFAAACLLVSLYFALHILITNQNRPQARGPFLQSVTTNSVWVVWETTSPIAGQVEFGPDADLGHVVEENERVLHHEVQLTGLKPYTLYYYRVDSGKVAVFRTAAAPGDSGFRFAVYGDTRSGDRVHRAIIRQMVDMQPDFILHTGDLVENGKAVSEWNRFFNIEEPLLRIAPFYPTLGNHEEHDSNEIDHKYLDVFHLPGDELWYTFEYGNARFISLKVDGYPLREPFPDDEQLAWLESTLVGNDAQWLIVFFHIGVFTSRSEDFLELGTRERLVPLFEKYGVDAVLMGHHHSYERILRNGITYIVTAGGGAELYELNEPEPGSQVAVSAHHFMVIEIHDNRLVGRAIDQHGRVIDSFELLADE